MILLLHETTQTPSMMSLHNWAPRLQSKTLGICIIFFGIEVVRHGSSLILSLRKYISNLIHKAGLYDCKPFSSPMSAFQILTLGDSPLLADPTKYRQLVGALQYASL